MPYYGSNGLPLIGGTVSGPVVSSYSSTVSSVAYSIGSAGSGLYSAGGDPGLAATNVGVLVATTGEAGGARVRLLSLGWSSGLSVTSDVRLERDAAAVLALRNSTTGQTYRVYNTWTDASNGEWAEVAWSSNVAYLRAQKNGTGTQRLMIPVTGSTVVASLPAAATAGAGARAFVTDATVTTFASTVVGSGANAVPVFSDGTNWKIG